MVMRAPETVVGVFEHRYQAERAVEHLRRAGFNEDDIGFASREGSWTKTEDHLAAADSGAAQDAGSGAVTGMLTGGIVGGLLAAGASLLIPGVGPIIGGGILAATLAGAATGAAAGGLIGALTGLGVSEDDARIYEEHVKSGRLLVTVQAGDRAGQAEEILTRAGAHQRDPLETVGPERARAYATNPYSAAIEDTTTAATGAIAATMPAAQAQARITDRPAAAGTTPTEPPATVGATGSAGPTHVSYETAPETAINRGTGAPAGPTPSEQHGIAARGGTQVRSAGSTNRGRPDGGSIDSVDQDTENRQRRGVEEASAGDLAPLQASAGQPQPARREDMSAAEMQPSARNGEMVEQHDAESDGGPVAPLGSGGQAYRTDHGDRPMPASMATQEMPAGTIGRWPVRADDPVAGKLVDGEEQRSTGDALSRSMEPGTSTRAPDAAAGVGPYVDPGEDLERVGATSGLAPWAATASRYHQQWQQQHSGSGARWEEAEPGYRYGHEMAVDPRYQGQQWDEVESNLGTEYRNWSRGRGYSDGGEWERVRRQARDAWDNVRQG